MDKQPYRKTEKWWLGLTVLFYALYNIPGFPPYGDPVTAIWHGVFTVIPLWIVIYWGLFKVIKQRPLRDLSDVSYKGKSLPEKEETA